MKGFITDKDRYGVIIKLDTTWQREQVLRSLLQIPLANGFSEASQVSFSSQ